MSQVQVKLVGAKSYSSRNKTYEKGRVYTVSQEEAETLTALAPYGNSGSRYFEIVGVAPAAPKAAKAKKVMKIGGKGAKGKAKPADDVEDEDDEAEDLE